MKRWKRTVTVAALAVLATSAVACSSRDEPNEAGSTAETTAEVTATTEAQTDETVVSSAPDDTGVSTAPADTESPETTAAAEEVRGGTVNLGVVAPPPSLDPAASVWGPVSAYYESVYDTILRVGPGGEIIPWLATDWEYDDTRTQLTLTLRDDVTFTDGSALTSEVVAANLQRFKDGTASTAVKLAGVTGIETPDESTVVITLAAPDPGFLTAISQEAGLIASGEALDDPTLATAPVGSGPYVLDTGATVIGSSYVYQKNPDYWNPDAQYFDTIAIRTGIDPIAAGNAMQAGEVDVSQLNAELQAIGEEAGWTIEEVNTGGFQGLMLFDRAGQLNPELGDVRVRQAFNFAIDRPTLIEAMNTLGAPTVQVMPMTGAMYDPAIEDVYPYDPDRARELLAEAGFEGGVTVAMPDLGMRDSWVFLDQMLAEVGITIDWQESTVDQSIGDIVSAKYAAVYFALGGPTAWDTVQQVVSPTAAFNPFKNQDPELDALIEQMQTGDEEAQVDAGQQINQYVVDNAWFAPVAASFSLIGASPRVELAEPTITTYPSIYNIRPV
jgi:peptide/nickel transport system substrate-binding protein